MTNLILTAALKGTIVLGRCLDCHGAAAPAFGRSAASHLAGRTHRDGAVAGAGYPPQTMRMTIDTSAAAPGTGGGLRRPLDAFARDRLARDRRIAAAAMGRGRLAAVSHHSAVARGGGSAGERRHPNSHDLGRDPAGDSGAGVRRGLARGAARRGDPARTRAHRTARLAVAGVRAGDDRGVLVPSAGVAGRGANATGSRARRRRCDSGDGRPGSRLRRPADGRRAAAIGALAGRGRCHGPATRADFAHRGDFGRWPHPNRRKCWRANRSRARSGGVAGSAQRVSKSDRVSRGSRRSDRSIRDLQSEPELHAGSEGSQDPGNGHAHCSW